MKITLVVRMVGVGLLAAGFCVQGHAQIIDSSTSNTLDASNGQKLVAGGSRLYIVYSQLGAIYVKSTNDGISWTSQSQVGNGSNPSIAASPSGTLGVLYEGGSGINYSYCKVDKLGFCSGWSSPVLLGGGLTPSLASVSGTMYATWSGNSLETIAYATFAPNLSSPPPIETVYTSYQFQETNSLPAVVAWQPSSGPPVITVSWFDAAPWATGPYPWWVLSSYSRSGTGSWVPSTKAAAFGPDWNTNMPAVFSLSATVNGAGQVTIGWSWSDFNGIFTEITPSTSVNSKHSSITLAALPGCRTSTVQVAVEELPMGGSAWYRLWDTSAGKWAASAITLPPNAATAVASGWSFYYGAIKGAYTDYVDVVYPNGGQLMAAQRHVPGLQQSPPPCLQAAFFH